MPGEQAMFGWEVVYTKFFGVPMYLDKVYYISQIEKRAKKDRHAQKTLVE